MEYKLEDDAKMTISREDEDNSEELSITSADDLLKFFSTIINHKMGTPEPASLYSALVKEFYIIPDFQRNFVWDKKQVTNLALSLIKGFPIPPLYVYRNENGRVLIDGQQRLTALFLYFNDLYFCKSRSIKKKETDSQEEQIPLRNLKRKIKFREIDKLCKDYFSFQVKKNELETEYAEAQEKGKSLETYSFELNLYNESMDQITKDLRLKHGLEFTEYLIEEDREKPIDITFSRLDEKSRLRILYDREMYVTEINCSGANPQKVYINIFTLLNSAGKILNRQEIRNGIYYESELYKSLSEFNLSNQNWRKLYGKVSNVSKDMELLLKMLSLAYYTEINSNEELTLKTLDFPFSWSNIMLGFSEDTKTGDASTYIHDLQLFFDNLVNIDKLDSKNGCNMAVLEALFVAMNKRKIEKQIDVLEVSELGDGETKKYDFPKIASNKESVITRLRAADNIVMGKEYFSIFLLG